MSISQKNDHSQAQFVEIDAERAGQRVDNFLFSYLRSVPKSMIYKILRTGQVRVNKGRVKPVYRLKAGDTLRIPPIRVSSEQEEKPQPARGILKQIEQSLLFEDERLIIINKPSGIAVHGGSGINHGVIEAMRVIRPELRDLELVHRLDRDTSGCLILAKKRSALRTLHELMREGEIGKYYYALCKGKWRGGAQDVKAPLLKNTLKSGERIVTVNSEGKPAFSRFVPKERFKSATLVEVELMTGRTHQIRVHGTYIGHPLAGDGKYGDKSFNQEIKDAGLKRLFLHAHRVVFPWGEGAMDIEAPMDDSLNRVLDNLRKISS